MSFFLGFLFLQLSLVQNTNYYIYTDSKDLTWISTVEGLQCFYGENVKIYDQSNSDIIGKNIQSYFYEDKNSNLWFSTHEGLNTYNRINDKIIGRQFYWENEKIKSDYRVYGIINGILWFGAEEFLFKYDINNSTVVDSTELDLSDFRLGYVFNLNSENILITGRNASTFAMSFQEKLNEVTIDTFQLSFSRMARIDNTLYLATNGQGIYKYNQEKRTFESDNRFGLDTRYITSNDSNILISNSEIVLLCENLDNCEKLNSNSPNAELYLDKNNVVFYSNDSKDLQYESLPKVKFNNIGRYNNEALTINGILEFEGKLWASSRYNGIFSFDSLFNIKSNYCNGNNGIGEDFVLDLIIWKGDLYACSATDLHRYNSKKDKFSPLNLNLEFNLETKVTAKENILISDPEAKKIYLLEDLNNPNLKIIEDFIDKAEDRLTFDEDLYNNLYISVNRKYLQVLEYDEISKSYKNPTRLEIPGIRDLCQINKDSIYIGNFSGLYLFLPSINKVHKIEDPDKKLNTTIYSIQKHKNYLWLGTPKGIIKYSIDDNTLFNFTIADGLQDIEFNTRSTYKDRNGYLYFGGVNGLNRFHPDSIKLLDIKPNIFISDILINDSKSSFPNTNLVSYIALPYAENTLSFYFNSLDFSDPVNTKVKYQLENYDKNWIFSGTNRGEVRYPNLPPGKYSLKLQASNSDGIWNDKVREIPIIIHPPWYATWWAKTIGIFLLGGLIYFTFKAYYKRQIQKKDLQLREANLKIDKQNALSEERTRIASEMHDDLGGGLTTIRFLSQKALRNTSDQSMKTLIQKIASNSEYLVNNMSEIIWAMNARFDTLDNLSSYCRRYANEYLEDNDIAVKFKIEGNPAGIKLTGIERRNIFLAIKEALHNVIKHSNAKTVSIIFRVNDELNILIKDDGIGMNNANTFGNGLVNMKKRILSINGQFKLDSSEQGTEIEILLPIQKDGNATTKIKS